MSIEMAEPPPVNYRSLFIFFGYLSLVAYFILQCCHTIYLRYRARQRENSWSSPRRQAQFFLFVLLAALSIGTTWYYMINLFLYSYRTWAASTEGQTYSAADVPLAVRMGLWLNKTYIFQEAWETVSATPTRFWWSGQIFGWTIGWSLFLAVGGRRYRIPSVWVYMLLGQAVSVSFAANLFFVAITVSRQPNERDVAFAWHPPLLYELVPVAVSLLITVAVPVFAYDKGFMLVLMSPHFLVFIPCLLGPGRSSSAPSQSQAHRNTWRYVTFMQWVAAASVVLQAYLTVLMIQYIGPDVPYAKVVQELLDTLYAHPACSSVSWDVIMCGVSALFWGLVHGFDPSQMVGGR
ncbi:uncharacterized protein BJX67DRAFT_352436 [Aspergillus lucknowensis]|uniref:Uncharacterized protein n=1 Tax=Aspergillus lucknowensis TaxID=176173 RepID=A0ABR4LSE9_9EURO